MSNAIAAPQCRTAGRAPHITLILGAAALLLHALPGATGLFGYDRAVPGQVWRVLTCHWVHWDGGHLFWSLGAFLVLGILCERDGRRTYLWCLGLSTLAIPPVIWLAMPGLGTYAGLSGLDVALFTLFACSMLREKLHERAWGWVAACVLLMLALLAKVAFEFLTGTAVFVDESSLLTPVPLAHAVGGAAGLATALTIREP